MLHRDHPQLQFTGLVLAWPDCQGSEQWFRYFLNASNHRSPVREDFATYVHEISYHWYSENGYEAPPPVGTWHTVGDNPADVFLQVSEPPIHVSAFYPQVSLVVITDKIRRMQSAQFLVSAARVQELIAEYHPTRTTGEGKLRTYCNEIGVLAPDPPPGSEPFGADRWWWKSASFAIRRCVCFSRPSLTDCL